MKIVSAKVVVWSLISVFVGFFGFRFLSYRLDPCSDIYEGKFNTGASYETTLGCLKQLSDRDVDGKYSLYVDGIDYLAKNGPEDGFDVGSVLSGMFNDEDMHPLDNAEVFDTLSDRDRRFFLIELSNYEFREGESTREILEMRYPSEYKKALGEQEGQAEVTEPPQTTDSP